MEILIKEIFNRVHLGETEYEEYECFLESGLNQPTQKPTQQDII